MLTEILVCTIVYLVISGHKGLPFYLISSPLISWLQGMFHHKDLSIHPPAEQTHHNNHTGHHQEYHHLQLDLPSPMDKDLTHKINIKANIRVPLDILLKQAMDHPTKDMDHLILASNLKDTLLILIMVHLLQLPTIILHQLIQVPILLPLASSRMPLRPAVLQVQALHTPSVGPLSLILATLHTHLISLVQTILM